MAIINCPECNKEISDQANACPHCGYPIANTNTKPVPKAQESTDIELQPAGSGSVATAELTDEFETFSPNEEVPAEKPKMSRKKKIIGIVLIGVIIVAGIVAAILINNAKTQNSYLTSMQSARITMLGGAATAETLCNLTRSVWYNTIYEETDSATDKYTKNGYSFNDDFNDSLMNLYTDADTLDKISSIETNRDVVATLMKGLTNPPEKYKSGYEVLSDLYSSYYELTELAVNPTGNLNSFSENFQTADSDFGKLFDKLDLYLPEE